MQQLALLEWEPPQIHEQELLQLLALLEGEPPPLALLQGEPTLIQPLALLEWEPKQPLALLEREPTQIHEYDGRHRSTSTSGCGF